MSTVTVPTPNNISDYKPLTNEELSRRVDAVRRKLGSQLLILGHHYQQDEVILVVFKVITIINAL